MINNINIYFLVKNRLNFVRLSSAVNIAFLLNLLHCLNYLLCVANFFLFLLVFVFRGHWLIHRHSFLYFFISGIIYWLVSFIIIFRFSFLAWRSFKYIVGSYNNLYHSVYKCIRLARLPIPIKKVLDLLISGLVS